MKNKSVIKSVKKGDVFMVTDNKAHHLQLGSLCVCLFTEDSIGLFVSCEGLNDGLSPFNKNKGQLVWQIIDHEQLYYIGSL